MKMIFAKKKVYLLKKTLIIACLSVCGVSHAASTSGASGSFSYIVPTAGAYDQCPGPYEPMAITAYNRTQWQYDWYGDHGRPVAINIYYVLNDQKDYTGPYVDGLTTDNSIYPIEIQGKNSPTGAWMPVSSTSGPIIGALLIKNEQQEPNRSWTDTFSAYPALTKEFGKNAVNVITEDFMHGSSTYMDYWKYNIPTLYIPSRNYKMLYIEVISGSVDYKKPTPADSFRVLRWEGVSVSPQVSGSKLKTVLSEVYYQKNSSEYGKARAISGLPLNGLIDPRAIDDIHVNIEGGNVDTLFSDSKITFDYLTSKKTGKTVVCQ